MKFDKEEIKEHHGKVIGKILSQYSREEAIRHITDYVMYRIGAIIKSERMKSDERVGRIQNEGHTVEGGNNGNNRYSRGR